MSGNTGKIAQALENAVDHHRAGRLDLAESIYRQVLGAQPLHPEALHLSGVLAHQLGQHALAAERIAQAVRLEPANPVPYLNLGEAYRALKRTDEARSCLETALALRPDYPEAHNNLGLLLHKQGRLAEARTHYEQALALRKDFAEASNNLARLLMGSGSTEEAVARYRRAVDLMPEDHRFHSHLVFALHFQPGLDPRELDEEHERWNHWHASPLRSASAPHTNPPGAARRLRVGYVSPDFRQHPISFFLYPLLKAHDPGQVEVRAYSDVRQPDAVTAGLKTLVSGWRDVADLSDEALAEQIRADGIDILVDLAMHTEGNRLLAFARRPAPVQVSWLAYPGTTGVESIDYRLTDRYMDPPGEGQASLPGGEPVRLPDAWCCYHPLGETPAVTSLPALRAGNGGAVTFGCLNSFNKTNAAVLRRWAGLLAAVPGSRLLMYCPAEATIRERVWTLLAGHGGVGRERVEFVATQGRQAYLQTYGRIDIGLDPFPFGGMTTTCEALWMGVPVLALPGATHGSRVGASLLATVGLTDLVARSEAEYIGLAAGLAKDLPRLARIRGTLRARMEASPLMDGWRFARHVERAYRAVWERWCRQQSHEK